MGRNFASSHVHSDTLKDSFWRFSSCSLFRSLADTNDTICLCIIHTTICTSSSQILQIAKVYVHIVQWYPPWKLRSAFPRCLGRSFAFSEGEIWTRSLEIISYLSLDADLFVFWCSNLFRFTISWKRFPFFKSILFKWIENTNHDSSRDLFIP